MKATRSSGSDGTAAKLVAALNKEWSRNEEYNLNALKKFESAEAIFQSDPAIQVAVARSIIELVTGIAKRAQGRGNAEWFTEDDFPWGCTYFLSSHLKRRLPFSEEDLYRMFSDVVSIGFISAGQFPFVGSLVSALERHADDEPLSDRLRRVLETFHDKLLGKGRNRRLWDPDAADRKAAARVERLLAGPLDLN